MIAAFFDTHCHLQDKRFGPGLDAVIDRALKAGVTHMVTCGTEESDWGAVLELANHRSCVIPLLGLHPWFIQSASPEWCRSLERQVEEHPVGIGECGLDFALAAFDREAQESAFRAQLQLARAANRPISIHCRKAWERLEAILREIGIPEAGAVIHSFSGSTEVALQLQRLGLHISFSCSLANPTNKRASKVVQAISLDHLLFETDAPDIPPRNLPGFTEGDLNEPANIRIVAQAAARLRAQDEDILSKAAYENANRVFGTLPGPQ